jgi:hypothetical protein
MNSGDYIFNPEDEQYKAIPYTQFDLGRISVSDMAQSEFENQTKEMTFYFSKINDEGTRSNKAII